MPLTKEKRIIITGGAQGIGRCTARHLLTRSLQHKVFLIDVNSDELVYCVEQHLAAYAPRVGYAVANLRKPEEIREAVAKAAEFFGGRVDVLVNNAGTGRSFFTAGNGTMEDVATGEQWQAYIETNLSGPFYMSQAVIPFMKSLHTQQGPVDRSGDLKRENEFNNLPTNLLGPDKLDEGACIINISSFRAHQSDPDCEGYGASKNGLLGLTQAMAVSCQRWGIRVVGISPGWIHIFHENKARDELELSKTENQHLRGLPAHSEELVALRNRCWKQDLIEKNHIQHPAGRVGRGEDIAETIEYAIGAGFLSGQELVLDGGANRRKNPNV